MPHGRPTLPAIAPAQTPEIRVAVRFRVVVKSADIGATFIVIGSLGRAVAGHAGPGEHFDGFGDDEAEDGEVGGQDAEGEFGGGVGERVGGGIWSRSVWLFECAERGGESRSCGSFTGKIESGLFGCSLYDRPRES